MSNVLKKQKKRDILWTNRQEKRSGSSVHSNTVNDSLVASIFKHLQFMGYMALDDRFGFGKKRLVRYWDAIQALYEKWQNNEYTTNELMICANSMQIDYVGYVSKIPFRYKLFLGGFKNNQAGIRDIRYVLDAPFIAYVLISSIVLKNKFRFSKNKINEFNDAMLYYMNSYADGYMSDETILEIMIEENGIDLENGQVLGKKVKR